MPNGIILKGIGGFYYVKTSDGIYESKARGVFRKEGITPLPGDEVEISIVDEPGKKGNLERILPRSSELTRPLVANIDQMIAVIAAKAPKTDFLLLDKLLITSEKKNIQAVLCINKVDLCESDECAKIAEEYRNAGYRVVTTSMTDRESFSSLKEVLKGKKTVFSGQSGVGKSTILNNIMNTRVMETGNISEKIERGKHTTRHAELVELDTGGYVLDTPGFSSFELADIRYNELELFLPEFQNYLNKCRFTGCSHISEPECAVKDALEKGDINFGRYSRYVQLYSALKQQKSVKG